MILLKSLHLRDFLSHKDTNVIFREEQKILVDGNSGSGKSSLIEAIIWALYGQARADNRSLVRRGAKKAEVMLVIDFTRGDTHDIFSIHRTMTAGGKHNLQVTITSGGKPERAHDLTGVRELQAWIENDLIGASYLLFVNSIAYLQGGHETFVTQNAQRRKELLLEIVKAGDFETYYEAARAKLGELGNAEKSAKQQMENATTWLENARAQVAGKQAKEDAISGIREQIQTYEQQRDALTVDLERKKEARARLQRAASVVNELERDIAILDEQIMSARAAERELAQMTRVERDLMQISTELVGIEKQISETEQLMLRVHEIRETRSRKLSEKPAVNDYTGYLAQLDRQMKAYQSEEQCPAGERCPHQRGHRQRVAETNRLIDETAEKMTNEKNALRIWEQEYAALEDIPQDTDARIRTLQKDKNARHVLSVQKDTLTRKLLRKAAHEAAVASLPDLEKQLVRKHTALGEAKQEAQKLQKDVDLFATTTAEKEYDLVKRQIHTARLEEERCVGDLAIINALEQQIPQREQEREQYSASCVKIAEDMAKLSSLKEAFGSHGIKAIVIDYLLPGLEERINVVLSQMSDFRVRLDTQKEKAGGDGNKEGLFITIVNEMGEEMAFENYSGGEKLKIVVAISEALATLQRVGFRLFDEVFVGLDENSTESFAGVLQHLQRNFGQILCVSHLQQIKDMFGDGILITKRNGVSYVTEQARS